MEHKIVTKAGHSFFLYGTEWSFLSFDCRPDSARVGLDRGYDDAGNPKRIEARQVPKGTVRRFSFAELGLSEPTYKYHGGGRANQC